MNYDLRIIQLRQDGMTCKQVAEFAGVSVPYVWNVMRRHGLNGKIRNYSGEKPRSVPRTPTQALKRVLQCNDSITIERGLNGGFIASIEDTWFGMECETIAQAIKSAEAAAE